VAASNIKRSDMLRAIELHDDPDPAALIGSLGFGPATKYRLVHEGRFYGSVDGFGGFVGDVAMTADSGQQS
jgi:hypothetical protein